MDGDEVNGLVAVLTGAEPSACDRDGLAGLVAVSQRVRSWLDAFDVTLASAAAQLAERGACEGPSTLLTDDGRRAVREAQAAVRRAQACSLLPALHDALADGAVSAGTPTPSRSCSASWTSGGGPTWSSSKPRW